MKKHWHVQQQEPAVVEALSREVGCSPLLASLLVNRQLDRPETARHFLGGNLRDLRSPFALRDMPAAVARIHRALKSQEHILIFGDYDADGVTATVLLSEFLRTCGARVSTRIPKRLEEGYGLQPKQIRTIADRSDVKLIITVDCGSSSHDAIQAARSAGVDVIVTDHHEVCAPPPAVAFVNPKRPDCTSGLHFLSGAGVAYYLVIALRKHLRENGCWPQGNEPNLKAYLDLVALGTVADMVPLTAENRIFVRNGLKVIDAGRRPGVMALKESGGILNRPAAAADIAYRMAPRLNAAGRVDDAALALELLTAGSASRARRLAATLDEFNGRRREIEELLIAGAEKKIRAEVDRLDPHALVLADRSWHEGVLGIAATRLVRRYWRPVILITRGDDSCRGSGRSIPGFDITAGLANCRQHLGTYGGHAMAAGLSILPENIAVFRECFTAAVKAHTPPEAFIPRISIDMELPLDQISIDLIEELERLEPFGVGNPEPLFMAREVRVVSARIVGGCHRRLQLTTAPSARGRPLSAIQFGIDPRSPPPERFERLAFRLRRDHWNGGGRVQLTIEDGE